MGFASPKSKHRLAIAECGLRIAECAQLPNFALSSADSASRDPIPQFRDPQFSALVAD
jgi:hypothetical protein